MINREQEVTADLEHLKQSLKKSRDARHTYPFTTLEEGIPSLRADQEDIERARSNRAFIVQMIDDYGFIDLDSDNNKEEIIYDSSDRYTSSPTRIIRVGGFIAFTDLRLDNIEIMDGQVLLAYEDADKEIEVSLYKNAYSLEIRFPHSASGTGDNGSGYLIYEQDLVPYDEMPTRHAQLINLMSDDFLGAVHARDS